MTGGLTRERQATEAGRPVGVRAVSAVWLLAGVLVVSQVLSVVQISALRARVVQIEAGVEFWEYGMGGCPAPSGGGDRPAAGGLAGWLPQGAV